MSAHPQELLLAAASPSTGSSAAARDQNVSDGRWLPLLERLETLHWIEPGERLMRTEPAGVGNMNRTLRVELMCNDSRRSLVLKQALPYVARYPEIPAPIERAAVEAAFYRAVAAVPDVASAMPRLLGFDAEYHLLALEDLGAARDFSALYDGQTEEKRAVWRSALPAIMDWLLALHTQAPTAAAPTNAAMRALNHEHIFEVPYAEPAAVEVPASLFTVRQQVLGDRRVRERLTALGALYLGQQPHIQPASRFVLLHGDYYPGSWLLDSSDQPHVIDPEFSFVGPAEFDLGVMRAHLAMAGEREATWHALLDRYRSSRAVDEALLEAFAAAEILRRIYGVAQLPLSLDEAEQLNLCTRAWKTLSG